MRRARVVHLTSAHPRFDSRIFYRMCSTLAQRWDVTLVVADGKGDVERDGVQICDVGAPASRKERLFVTTRRVLQKALGLDADLYHIHDPELIFAGLRLKMAGKKVIFDAHEDLPKQLLSKHYLPPVARRALFFTAGGFERFALRAFDHIVAATPAICEKFRRYGLECTDIKNYPAAAEYENVEPAMDGRAVCYVGSLYPTRGIRQIVEAIEGLDLRLILAGRFYDAAFEQQVRSLPGWEQVDYRGYVDQNEVKKIYAQSSAGLVTLHPTPAYVEAYPVKLFEYMHAGLPVVASRFYEPLLRECGVGTDPTDPDAIRKKLSELLGDLERAKKMGECGRRLARERYSWERERERLLGLYEKVLGDG